MDVVLALLNCDDCSNIFQLALVASAATKSVNRKSERGSLEFDLKAHTLRGRWIDDKALKSKSVPLSSMSSVVFGIERHTIFPRAIKVGRGKASGMIAKTYRVLTVFDKMSNKRFMTGQLPKLWSKLTKEEDKKKYKVRIRMVVTEAL